MYIIFRHYYEETGMSTRTPSPKHNKHITRADTASAQFRILYYLYPIFIQLPTKTHLIMIEVRQLHFLIKMIDMHMFGKIGRSPSQAFCTIWLASIRFVLVMSKAFYSGSFRLTRRNYSRCLGLENVKIASAKTTKVFTYFN